MGTTLLLIGASCGAIGMFVSYHEDVSSGSAIVLLAAGIFAVVYAGTSFRRVTRPAAKPWAEREVVESLQPSRDI